MSWTLFFTALFYGLFAISLTGVVLSLFGLILVDTAWGMKKAVIYLTVFALIGLVVGSALYGMGVWS
ncbi:hypothetical protein D3C73_1570810 [compost metagenome]